MLPHFLDKRLGRPRSIHFDPDRLIQLPKCSNVNKDLPPTPVPPPKPKAVIAIAQSSRMRCHRNPLPPVLQPDELDFQTGDSFKVVGVSGTSRLWVQSLQYAHKNRRQGWITSHPSFVQIHDAQTRRHIPSPEFYDDLVFSLGFVAGHAKQAVIVDPQVETPGIWLGPLDQERYHFNPVQHRSRPKTKSKSSVHLPPDKPLMDRRHLVDCRARSPR